METVEDKYLVSKRQLLPLFNVISDLVDPNYSNSTIIIKDIHKINGEKNDLKMKFSKSKNNSGKKINKMKEHKLRHKILQTSPRQGLFTKETQDQTVPNEEGTMAPIYEVLNEDIKDKSGGTNPSDLHWRKRHVLNECKPLLRSQKRKLTKKYEDLVVSLMDRCEENIIEINQLDLDLNRNSDKLKSMQESGFLLVEENDRLKRQLVNVTSFAEECKIMIAELEVRNAEMESKLSEYDVPCKDTEVIINSICINCNEKEIKLRQSELQNASNLREINALKEIISVLNDQLSKFHDKLKYNSDNELADHKKLYAVAQSNMLKTLNLRDKATEMSYEETCCQKEKFNAEKFSTLLKAYNEAISEKDNLIRDYEIQFEAINKRNKTTVNEKLSYEEALCSCNKEIQELKEKSKQLFGQKEAIEYELIKMRERAENAESKLKEVYNAYEEKISTLNRDYETVHREYFVVRNSLVQAENKAVSLETALRSNQVVRTVPADVHVSRIQEFHNLFEDLKHQHSLSIQDSDKKMVRAEKNAQELAVKLAACEEKEKNLKCLLDEAIKSSQLWRRAAKTLKSTLRSRRRYSVRGVRTPLRTRKYPDSVTNSSLSVALHQVQKIKTEIQHVKDTAYRELARVETRIKDRERALYFLEQQHDLDMSRMRVLLQHKEAVIANLVNKLAEDDRSLSHGSLVAETEPPKKSSKRNVCFQSKQVPGGFMYMHSKKQ